MNKNNLIFYFAGIIVASLFTLYLPWGTFIAETGMVFVDKIEVTTTGLNGNLTFSSIKIPHWLLVAITVISALISILNIQKMIQTPKIIGLGMDIFVLAWLGLGLYSYMNNGGLQIGLILITLTTLTNLYLQLQVIDKK